MKSLIKIMVDICEDVNILYKQENIEAAQRGEKLFVDVFEAAVHLLGREPVLNELRKYDKCNHCLLLIMEIPYTESVT